MEINHKNKVASSLLGNNSEIQSVLKELYPAPTLTDVICNFFIMLGIACGLLGMPVLLILQKLL
jgi:hypothetical protein